MKKVVISLMGLLFISFVSSEAYAQNGRFESNHVLSYCHLVSGKILRRLGNYEQADKEFNKAIKLGGGHNKEAYYELGKFYYERSIKEVNPELRLIYRRKSIDTFGRFLASAGHPQHGTDVARYNEIKQLRNLMESQIRSREPIVFSNPVPIGESEQEEESSLENSFSLTGKRDELRFHNEPTGLREPLAMNRGSDGLHSVTEKGDAFYRKKPFTLPIKGEVYLVSRGNVVKRKTSRSRDLNKDWMVGL